MRLIESPAWLIIIIIMTNRRNLSPGTQTNKRSTAGYLSRMKQNQLTIRRRLCLRLETYKSLARANTIPTRSISARLSTFQALESRQNTIHFSINTAISRLMWWFTLRNQNLRRSFTLSVRLGRKTSITTGMIVREWFRSSCTLRNHRLLRKRRTRNNGLVYAKCSSSLLCKAHLPVVDEIPRRPPLIDRSCKQTRLTGGGD